MDDDARTDTEITLNQCKNLLLQKLYDEGLLSDVVTEEKLQELQNSWIVAYAAPATFLTKGQRPKIASKGGDPTVIIAITNDLTRST